MDSFQKYAESVFGSNTELFKHVEQGDLDEVLVSFSLLVSDLQYSDNYRVFPWSMKKEYYAKSAGGCCGSWDTSLRCKSGNVYLMGCNFGH